MSRAFPSTKALFWKVFEPNGVFRGLTGNETLTTRLTMTFEEQPITATTTPDSIQRDTEAAPAGDPAERYDSRDNHFFD
jgi:hypothetical protein